MPVLPARSTFVSEGYEGGEDADQGEARGIPGTARVEGKNSSRREVFTIHSAADAFSATTTFCGPGPRPPLVAWAVSDVGLPPLYLASNASDYMNGQTILLDGAWYYSGACADIRRGHLTAFSHRDINPPAPSIRSSRPNSRMVLSPQIVIRSTSARVISSRRDRGTWSCAARIRGHFRQVRSARAQPNLQLLPRPAEPRDRKTCSTLWRTLKAFS
jgi:hypothetical protein